MLNKKPIKVISIVLLLMFAIVIFSPIVFADPDTDTPTTILERVREAQGGDGVSDLEENISTAAESFITFLRNTAIIVAVIMFIIVAYGLLFSPDVRTISDCKGKVGALVAAIFIAVMAEQIVGTLMGWFG